MYPVDLINAQKGSMRDNANNFLKTAVSLRAMVRCINIRIPLIENKLL